MTVTTLGIKDASEKVRQVQFVGNGPHFLAGERIEALGTVSWELGGSCNIAEVSAKRPIPFSSLRFVSYTTWEGSMDLHVGDEIVSIAKSSTLLDELMNPGRTPATPEELMTEQSQIIDAVERGDFVNITDKL